jgi:hypothetical protein
MYAEEELELTAITFRVFNIMLGIIIALAKILGITSLHVDIIVILCLYISANFANRFLISNEKYCLLTLEQLWCHTIIDANSLTQAIQYFHRVLNGKSRGRKQLTTFTGFMSLHYLRCKDPNCPINRQATRFLDLNKLSSNIQVILHINNHNFQQHKYILYLYQQYSRE